MLTGYLRQRCRTLLAFFLFGGIFAAAFALYQLPLRAVAYPFVLCAAAGAVLLTLDYRRVLRQHRRLELLRQLPEELADALPPADTVTEADYRSLVTLLAESRRAIRTQEEQRYGDMVDYYTMWAHQIKTPIASMRLTLQNEDSDLARSLSGPPPCPTRERKSASVWARRKRCRSENRPKSQTKHDTPSGVSCSSILTLFHM